VSVVDVRTGEVAPGQDIEIRDGLIASIGPAAATAATAATAAATPAAAPRARTAGSASDNGEAGGATWDGTGLWAVPGMMDAHCHLSNSARPDVVQSLTFDLPSFYSIRAVKHARDVLRAGITAIRDVGGIYFTDVAIRDAVLQGLIEGPRVRAGGPSIRMTGGHGDVRYSPSFSHSIFQPADGVDEVRKAARRNLKYGADVIKVLSGSGGVGSGTDLDSAQYSEAEIAAAVEVARDAGKKVAIHSHSSKATKRGVRAGVASVEHGTYLDREAVDMMAEAGTFLVPTFIALRRILEHGAGEGIPAIMVERAKEADEIHLKSFQLALAAGVRVAMGTDAGTPFNLHGENATEIALMAEAGMSPAAALRAATIETAELLDWSDSLGSLEVGKRADIVLFDVDPLADLAAYRDTRHVRLVLKDGAVCRDDLTR
jgi:imidazolonepropionase-like amidohydrolase